MRMASEWLLAPSTCSRRSLLISIRRARQAQASAHWEATTTTTTAATMREEFACAVNLLMSAGGPQWRMDKLERLPFAHYCLTAGSLLAGHWPGLPLGASHTRTVCAKIEGKLDAVRPVQLWRRHTWNNCQWKVTLLALANDQLAPRSAP